MEHARADKHSKPASQVNAGSSLGTTVDHLEEPSPPPSDRSSAACSDGGSARLSKTSVADGHSSQRQRELAFTKAPPPIKTRRDHSHAASPPELSPPPSPKRMRELERKEGAFSLLVPKQKLQKLQEQNS